MPAQLAMPLEAANDAAPASSPADTDDVLGSAEEGEAEERISSMIPRAGRFVQHLGTWLMLASVAQLGLHRRADEVRRERVEDDALRIAIDSVVCALSIGMEGDELDRRRKPRYLRRWPLLGDGRIPGRPRQRKRCAGQR